MALAINPDASILRAQSDVRDDVTWDLLVMKLLVRQSLILEKTHVQ